MANIKTPEEASDLPRAEKFIREHLSVSELSNDFLRILYNFAFTNLKYINKKVTLSQEDAIPAKVARELVGLTYEQSNCRQRCWQGS